MKYEGGAIRVPTGPGLGVALDEDKMRHYGAFYEETVPAGLASGRRWIVRTPRDCADLRLASQSP